MTVRDLVQKLILECNLDDEIYIGDNEGGHYDIAIGCNIRYVNENEWYAVRTIECGEAR